MLWIMINHFAGEPPFSRLKSSRWWLIFNHLKNMSQNENLSPNSQQHITAICLKSYIVFDTSSLEILQSTLAASAVHQPRYPGLECVIHEAIDLSEKIALNDFMDRGHYITNSNNTLLQRENPSKLPYQNYHTFALFDPSKMGNFKAPFRDAGDILLNKVCRFCLVSP